MGLDGYVGVAKFRLICGIFPFISSESMASLFIIYSTEFSNEKRKKMLSERKIQQARAISK